MVALTSDKEFVALSAVNATVKDVREVIAAAERRLGHGQGTILFLDEVHRFNKAQQDALLPAVESGLIVLVGATTENPYFEVNPPLLSRSTLFRLERLDPEALSELADRGLEAVGATADDDAKEHLVLQASGDGAVLTTLEVAMALADGGHITLAHAEAAADAKALGYGTDDHYDVISAFIKSIRGSDVDAGLYWLAVMLESGEDPRFIARRLVILASEDVGMADPNGTQSWPAAAAPWSSWGCPRLSSTWPRSCTWPPHPSRTGSPRHSARPCRTCTSGPGPRFPRTCAASRGSYQYPHDDPRGVAAAAVPAIRGR